MYRRLEKKERLNWKVLPVPKRWKVETVRDGRYRCLEMEGADV